MAKQRINVLEAHVEKVVLGLTAAVLLVVAFFYLVQTPNVIEAMGQTYGPGDYDKDVVRTKADNLKAMFNRPPAAPEPIPDMLREFKRLQEQPLASVGGAARWPAVQPWRPAVPPALGVKPVQPGQIRLAQGVPPNQPLAYTGLTTIEVEAPQPLGAAQKTPQEREDLQATIREKDHSWVTVAAVFPLEAQRQEFRRAFYDSDLRDIIICRVRAQRQKLLPNGTYGAWEEVKPWTPYVPLDAPEVQLVPRSDSYSLAQKFIDSIRQYIDAVWNYALDVKTPMPFYEQAGDKWRLPALKDVNWCTLDLQWLKLPPDEDGCNPYYAVLPKPVEAIEGGKPRESLPPHVQRRIERKQAADDYRRAEELFKTGKLDDLYECERLLRGIKSNKYASPRLKDKADKLLASVLIKIDELEAQRTAETPEQPAQQQPVLPTVEEEQPDTVVWVHDLPVESGHTYRYRLAVDFYNTYVGNYDKLKDLDAASSLLVRGEWSIPSDPVTVKPEMAFFVTSVDDQEAKIDVYKWFRGRVAYRKVRARLGERITLQDFVRIPGERDRFPVDFDTGFNLISMEERNVLVRESVGREGAFRYREEATPVIVCADDRGRLIERCEAANQEEQREWASLAKKYKTE
jgi:hypothetical protein